MGEVGAGQEPGGTLGRSRERVTAVDQRGWAPWGADRPLSPPSLWFFMGAVWRAWWGREILSTSPHLINVEICIESGDSPAGNQAAALEELLGLQVGKHRCQVARGWPCSAGRAAPLAPIHAPRPPVLWPQPHCIWDWSQVAGACRLCSSVFTDHLEQGRAFPYEDWPCVILGISPRTTGNISRSSCIIYSGSAQFIANISPIMYLSNAGFDWSSWSWMNLNSEAWHRQCWTENFVLLKS